MNKQQFLAAINYRLSGLSPADIAKSLDYYSEMIDDRMEDGLSEEEAVAAMGSIDDIVEQIIMETPLTKLVKAKARPSRALEGWEIALLIVSSPIWATLLLSAVVTVLAIYISFWAIIFSFFAADLAVVLGAFSAFYAGGFYLFNGGPAVAVFALGAGLLLSGIAIFFFFLCELMFRGALRLSKLGVRKIKSCFIGKGA